MSETATKSLRGSPRGYAENAGNRTDFEINVTPVERVLRRSPIVGIGEFRCPIDHPQFAGGGPQTCPYIVFPRTSVRLLPGRGRSEVCTPNIVSLFNVGDTYERKAISREGDESDWIAISPAVLRDIAAPYITGRDADTGHIFAQSFAPLDSRTYLAQRQLFRTIHDSKWLATLAVEEYVIELVAVVLHSASRFWNRPCRPGKLGSATSLRRQMAIADEAKSIMAVHYCGPLSIQDIAQKVHCSPGYLCRTFKRLTGFTLHRYLQQLRLRVSLQLLLESWMDFAAIAEHLGFANHSHFTDIFHRQFGITPTMFVKRRSMALSRKLNAVLDARSPSTSQQRGS